MTDLQSVALATWLRSRLTVDRPTCRFELNLPNRENRNCHDKWIIIPTAQVGGILVAVLGVVNRVDQLRQVGQLPC